MRRFLSRNITRLSWWLQTVADRIHEEEARETMNTIYDALAKDENGKANEDGRDESS
jgi:hypothetical protein